TEAHQNARPVMRGTTSLHHHRATFLLLEECDQLAPAHLALELCLSSLVHAVDLEDGLGSIQANHGNAHRGRLLVGSNGPQCGTSLPLGPSTPSTVAYRPCTALTHHILWLSSALSAKCAVLIHYATVVLARILRCTRSGDGVR